MDSKMESNNNKNKKKDLSNGDAFIHLVKSTLGGGFLAMPEAFKHAGIILGYFGIAIIGVAVMNMMSFLAMRSGKYATIIAEDRRARGLGGVPDTPAKDSNELWLPPMSYPETVEAVFRYGARGRFARYATFFRSLTFTMLLCTYYGVNIVYVCIIASSNKQLIDQHSSEDNLLYNISIRYYPAIISLVVFPIGMIFNLKALVIISKVANGVILTAGFIIFYFILGGDKRKAEHAAKHFVLQPTQWCLFAGTSLCSLEGIGVLLHIEGKMITPKSLAGPPHYVLHYSMVAIIVVNAVLGGMGYSQYGESVLGSISFNLPPNNYLADTVKVLVAWGIVLTYGLQLNVTADLLWPLLRNMINHFNPGFLNMQLKPDEELTPEQNADPMLQRDHRRTKCAYFIMRSILILGTVIIATIEPRVEPLISLVGAVGFSTLGLIVPVIMETVWYWYSHEEDGENVIENEEKSAPAKTQSMDPTDAVQQGCWNVNAPTNHIGIWSIWATIRGNSSDTHPDVVTKSSPKWRTIERFARNAKNVGIFVLALCALVGGAYYNVQQIVYGIGVQ